MGPKVSTTFKQLTCHSLLGSSTKCSSMRGTFRVLKRVKQIIDEKNGKMLRTKSSCIILDGSACAADYYKLCPRAIYHYWREGWPDRLGPHPFLRPGGDLNPTFAWAAFGDGGASEGVPSEKDCSNLPLYFTPSPVRDR
jgi:hypothetical protein